MPARKMNASALQFLILAMNKEQELFQFEFYNFHPATDHFLELFDSGKTVVRAERNSSCPPSLPRRGPVSTREMKNRTV